MPSASPEEESADDGTPLIKPSLKARGGEVGTEGGEGGTKGGEGGTKGGGGAARGTVGIGDGGAFGADLAAACLQ